MRAVQDADSVSLDRNHEDLVRFASAEDIGFAAVLRLLQDTLDEVRLQLTSGNDITSTTSCG